MRDLVDQLGKMQLKLGMRDLVDQLGKMQLKLSVIIDRDAREIIYLVASVRLCPALTAKP